MQASSRPTGVAAEPPAPPCGFTTFVAEQHGMSLRDAERLIESWLESYEPLARPIHPLSTEGCG